jgi:hypothetical protein
MSAMSRPVIAEVKNVLTFGEGAPHDASLDGYIPPDREHFGFQAQVFIGQQGDDRCDSFDIKVCSPSWFAEKVAASDSGWTPFNAMLTTLPENVLPGAGIWFMQQWDRSAFDAALNAVCQVASGGPDWGSVAARIGRLIPWEFDYKFDEHVDRR